MKQRPELEQTRKKWLGKKPVIESKSFSCVFIFTQRESELLFEKEGFNEKGSRLYQIKVKFNEASINGKKENQIVLLAKND